MHWTTIAYPLILALGYAVVYLFLYFFFPHFFSQRAAKFSKQQLFSIPLLIFLSLLMWQVSVAMANQELGNRLLHAVGGGVLASLACFLAVKDSRVKITKPQFFILTVLIVTALGVANELAEFFLQQTTGEIFASTITDTWLDLLSNTLGTLVATLVALPFVKKPK
ncbi:MAG: hypothetical protein COU10_02450 [Candidatus Harrisonbacteria bacterium CG10_big_fil_rev_8_21_14_0_10_45_28]|uniref:VanZ-like domain-containing protein n=1 Tax=Candidatus Harrisonbacteria bacterium CG10_big_fil_rev_8_21_14_0_10_45_28 TaxID=1974586 RepID=A0A2H0UN55_9BACT|nr:MAG: hypothetical protein COU10_02450 [Candidatus Harrisonbacteria bacterium CG10_big_fil_rev_8_21_14_0_10_45_28]